MNGRRRFIGVLSETRRDDEAKAPLAEDAEGSTTQKRRSRAKAPLAKVAKGSEEQDQNRLSLRRPDSNAAGC
jgi:hypothetical protein